MKLQKLIFLLGLISMFAPDMRSEEPAPKEPTIESLKAEIAQLKADAALQAKIAQAFLDQATSCNIQFTVLKAKQPPEVK